MFGLCMPSGEIYLLLKNGVKESIEIADYGNPRKHIMEDKYILEWVNNKGYKNIEAIVYERDSKKVVVPMADYYAEHGTELKEA